MALISVHTADLHFGCRVNPMEEYRILKEQLVDRVENLPFDIFSINGDIFDKKVMANTEAVLAANKLISDIVNLCKRKNATLILLAGTRSHDAGQLRLFYHYTEDPGIDIRIVEQIQFLSVKGHTILCIPELYGVPESTYHFFLHEVCIYDMCFMHGTFEGAIYGNNVKESRLFTMNDFKNCRGPIISGHVHTGGCFQKYFYYTGSPIRYSFGEEEDKGFLVVLYDRATQRHYVHMSKIESYRYDTIDLESLAVREPHEIIQYIDNLHNNGIDFIRVILSPSMSAEAQALLKSHWANSGKDYIKFKLKEIKSKAEQTATSDEDILNPPDFPSYLYDNNMSPYDKLARFINEGEGQTAGIVITAEEIKDICNIK